MSAVIFDASGQILGRMCSVVAKRLLKGDNVVIVNVEKAILSGNPKATKALYLEKIQRGDPGKGPFFPKTPEGIVRRTVRGMLPWNRTKGREAYKRLRVYTGVPEEFAGKEMQNVKNADSSKLKSKYITIGKLALQIGAKKRW